MAHVVILATRIQKAVDLKVKELEAEAASYREWFIKAYTGEDYRLWTGCLWWKTSRLHTREEAEKMYDAQFTPRAMELNWEYLCAQRREDACRRHILQAERLAKAAKETDGVYITLSEHEVAFLKLSGDDNI